MNRAIIAFLLVVAAVSGCRSAELREPVEKHRAAADFTDRGVKEIAVLPIDTSTLPEERIGLIPVLEMRLRGRRFLIGRKNYACSREDWVDGRIASGASSAGDLDAEGLLSVRLTQWEGNRLASQGVVYIGAEITLEDRAGDVIWSYVARDLRIAIPPSHGREPAVMRAAAAREFIERALWNIPANR